MAGHGDPPEGTPKGTSGGDDEYRSVVFDESFVRAARIQEYSATERMGPEARAVRTRKLRVRGSVSRQAFALILIIALAFGTAVYMGIRHPYQEPEPQPSTELAITLIPLAPQAGASLSPGRPDHLFDDGPAAHYRDGAEGVTLPAARRTDHFSESQVLQAVTQAKDYLVASSVDPDVLLGEETRSVRRLLDPDQLAQFDSSLDRPVDDGRHAVTGWMVRFDPEKVALADTHVRVNGTIEVREAGSDALVVATDHTFVYAVQAATDTPGHARPVLFTIRRELSIRFDRAALRDSHLTLVRSAAEMGPQDCSVDGAEYFQPLLPAGGGKADAGKAKAAGGTDPYDHERPAAAVCGVLSTPS